MQTFVNVHMVRDADMKFKSDDMDFMAEFAKGYLQVEITKKQESLMEYQNAFYDLKDKDSFNAEYISTLIDVLKMEIRDMKKI